MRICSSAAELSPDSANTNIKAAILITFWRMGRAKPNPLSPRRDAIEHRRCRAMQFAQPAPTVGELTSGDGKLISVPFLHRHYDMVSPGAVIAAISARSRGGATGLCNNS